MGETNSSFAPPALSSPLLPLPTSPHHLNMALIIIIISFTIITPFCSRPWGERGCGASRSHPGCSRSTRSWAWRRRASRWATSQPLAATRVPRTLSPRWGMSIMWMWDESRKRAKRMKRVEGGVVTWAVCHSCGDTSLKFPPCRPGPSKVPRRAQGWWRGG